MGSVVNLPVVTRLDIDPSRVLDGAQKAGLTNVVILGYDENGDEYFASSYADGGNMLWLLRRAEHALMRITDEMIEGDEDDE